MSVVHLLVCTISTVQFNFLYQLNCLRRYLKGPNRLLTGLKRDVFRFSLCVLPYYMRFTREEGRSMEDVTCVESKIPGYSPR